MLTNRQFEILYVLIKEYNETHKPISSSKLSNHFKLSPSMLRYELRELEEEELIEKESFSSGRIPTEKGYQYFYKNFNSNLSSSTQDEVLNKLIIQIEDLFNERNQNIETILNSAFQLVTSFTQTIILKEPHLKDVFIQDFIFYPIQDTSRLNIVFLFSDGRTYNQVINIDSKSQSDFLSALELFRKQIKGVLIDELDQTLKNVFSHLDDSLKQFEAMFFELVQMTVIKNFRQPKVENINSLMEYFDNQEDLNLLKNLLLILKKKSIWEIIEENNPTEQSKNDELVYFKSSDQSLSKSVLIKKKFQIYGDNETFFFIGKRNKNYQTLLKILDYIANKLKDF